MTGSSKQIEWATKIQAEYIRDVRKQQEYKAKDAEKAGQLVQWNAAMDDVVAQAEAKQDAAWWIDNRQHTTVVMGQGAGQIFRDMYTAAVAKIQAQ
jgi:hypothetical protein